MTIPFFQVDAFADAPFTGNPAAVMILDAWRDDHWLQAVAADNNLSETAFLVAGDSADYELRWFTPTSEVALCGHATLASGHVVLSQAPARHRVSFATRQAGVLSVTRAERGYALGLPAWTPTPQPLDEIATALGVVPVATLWHAQRYAVVVLPDEAAVRACRPDFVALAQHGDVLAIVTAPGDSTDIVSRAFAPGVGIDEDPVTGSAHAVIAPYWAERLGRDNFTAHQASARGGTLHCRVTASGVVLSGGCRTVIEGGWIEGVWTGG